MRRFDLNRALSVFVVISAWYSAGICSNWYGLAGPRVKKAPLVEFCMLVTEVSENEKLLDKCAQKLADHDIHDHH